MQINPTQSQEDNSILSKLASDSFIKKKVDEIKTDDDFKNEQDLITSDQRKNNIMAIAEYMEGQLNKFGFSNMINEISIFITRLFEKAGMERYSYLILETLPDKYKNKNKDQYKKHRSRLKANRIKRLQNEILSMDLSDMEPDDLYEIKNMSLALPDNCDKQLLIKGKPTIREYTDSETTDKMQLEDLKQMERNKFRKATIGEAFTTAEKLCAENPEYAEKFPILVKTLDQLVKGTEIMRDWFTKEFPPLTVEDLEDLTHGFKMFLENWRPHFDKKYRRDHAQSIKTAYTRVLHTSTKASHESQIPCAHYLDKNGLPVMRGLTKEQIDAMYEWEINFNQEFMNVIIGWRDLISRVNAKHGGRNLEDRAIALSDTLSHHA